MNTDTKTEIEQDHWLCDLLVQTMNNRGALTIEDRLQVLADVAVAAMSGMACVIGPDRLRTEADAIVQTAIESAAVSLKDMQ